MPGRFYLADLIEILARKIGNCIGAVKEENRPRHTQFLFSIFTHIRGAGAIHIEVEMFAELLSWYAGPDKSPAPDCSKV